ncbi:MAG: adenylosuccinate lyase, partial [Nanoarchaeota archaeon]|nr:adenylosuccinate lyase [Nanoarchaeota archaeon]
MEIHTLDAISSVDGRYRHYIEELADYFSEDALILNRLKVEAEYFIFLSEHPKIKVRKFSDKEKGFVRWLYKQNKDHSFWVKNIETEKHCIKEINNGKPTNHDVKAVEYYMKYKLKDTSLEDCLEWIHFGLTSEDINNMAYGLMLSDSLENIMIPKIETLQEKIEKLAQEHKNVPMLARTHGQPASPTTLGKEFKVYSSRLERQIQQLKKYHITVKFNGATGNYNAHKIAYPKINWQAFSKKFINSFNKDRQIKLKPNLITTQIEPHDTYAELFDNMKRINVILTDFNQDIWRYISDDWITQKPVKGDVGSSTMPHKVNPIDFENSEGNLGLANTLFEYFGRKLPISRLQRDLSDSTVERNFGLAFAHTL